MRLCIPIENADGLAARVCQHFGSAPRFIFVDTGSKEWTTVQNSHAHGRGRCGGDRLALAHSIDAVVCRELGSNARKRLLEAGVEVLRTDDGSVEDVLARLETGELRTVERDGTCRDHQHH